MRAFLIILCVIYAVACSMERCGCYALEIISVALKSAAFASLAMIVSYNYEHRA